MREGKHVLGCRQGLGVLLMEFVRSGHTNLPSDGSHAAFLVRQSVLRFDCPQGQARGAGFLENRGKHRIWAVGGPQETLGRPSSAPSSWQVEGCHMGESSRWRPGAEGELAGFGKRAVLGESPLPGSVRQKATVGVQS